MEKSPAFQWYAKDFLTDLNVVLMNLEQRGAYITLLSQCWLEGSLPEDQTKLQAICNHPSNWDEIWLGIGSCFVANGKGGLINPRLEKERKKQEEWRTKSRKGGILSGKSRREKASKGGSQMVQTKTQPKGNSSSSVFSLQSSSSIASSKEKKITEMAKWVKLARSFLEQQKDQFPNESALVGYFETCVTTGAAKLHLFNTKEKWSYEEIDELLCWILDDEFWSRQIRTLGGIRIRKHGKGNPMKFENARVAMEMSPKEYSLEKVWKEVREKEEDGSREAD